MTKTELKDNQESDVNNQQKVTVITLWQPWATFLIKGVKTYETRSWPTSHRGRILIHAAKRRINWNELNISELEKHYPDIRNWDYPLGAIVGETELFDCQQMSDIQHDDATYLCINNSLISPVERLVGNYQKGRYAWRMQNPKPLSIPDVAGKQGLWRFDISRLQKGDVKQPETATFCLTDFTYQQTKAIQQAILYGYQKQITPYSAFWELQLDEIMTEQGLLLANRLDDFIPTAQERDLLIEKITPWLKTTQPENYCETCDGLGRFVARRSDGSTDWEITHTYHCENCDGTGISDLVQPFSNGEEYCFWFRRNCLLCEKHAPLLSPTCEIDIAVTQAYYSDGLVSKAFAKRMADKNGKCTEFVSREELKAENFGLSETEAL